MEFSQYEVLYSDVSLSFWGGVDPMTGIVIDHSHPLQGECVSGKVLCIPSGRGSCTGSQVMLELILNKTSPKAIILRDVDSILCTGAIIAEEFFPEECQDSNGSSVPMIFAIGESYGHFKTVKNIYFTKEENNDVLNQGFEHRESMKILREDDPNKVRISAKNLLDQEISRYNIENLGLFLTPDEQEILEGKSSDNSLIEKAKTLSMRTIVRVSSIPLQASKMTTRLIPIKSAHIDGVTFIGMGGLRFVEELVKLGGKVEVPTSLNSQSVDRRRWEDLGVDFDFASKANRVGDAYLKLGCDLSFTCAPYLIPKSTPSFGDQIMWGESNAVVYANSVIGARTEKYADYFDICAAIIGKIPLGGVHIEENRQPGVVLDATQLIKNTFLNETSSAVDIDSFFPTMGWLCGTLSDGKVPLILGFDQISSMISDDDFKSFCAAYGTTGTAPLFHMARVTPEAVDEEWVKKMLLHVDEEKWTLVSSEQLKDAFRTLNGLYNHSATAGEEKIDLVAFGNPHLSLSEMRRLVQLIKNDDRQKNKSTKVIATLSRTIYEEANKLGYVKQLEEFGVQFVNDTCWCMMTDEPIIPQSKDATIITNSAKYAHYGVGLTQRKLRFGSMSDCVNVAKEGKRFGKNLTFPSWLKINQRSFMSIVKRLR